MIWLDIETKKTTPKESPQLFEGISQESLLYLIFYFSKLNEKSTQRKYEPGHFDDLKRKWFLFISKLKKNVNKFDVNFQLLTFNIPLDEESDTYKKYFPIVKKYLLEKLKIENLKKVSAEFGLDIKVINDYIKVLNEEMNPRFFYKKHKLENSPDSFSELDRLPNLEKPPKKIETAA